MSLTGKMKSSYCLVLIICFLLAGNCFSAGVLIPLGGEIPKNEKTQIGEVQKVGDPLVMGTSPGERMEGESNSSYVPGQNLKEASLKLSEQNKLIDKGNYPLSAKPDRGYVSYETADLVDKMNKAGKSSFSFLILKDEFDYASAAAGSFDSTYRRLEAQSSDPAYMLILQGERFLLRSWVEFSWGVNAGIGYNGGYGIFSNGQQSTAFLRLWTIPVDAVFSMKIPMTSWIKLSASAGPSAIGLLQYRNDLEDGNREKRIRTGSWGYFASGKLQISLSDMSSSFAYEFFRDYEITKVYLNLEARMHDYSNFKDAALSISGTSIGAGFTFEYL